MSWPLDDWAIFLKDTGNIVSEFSVSLVLCQYLILGLLRVVSDGFEPPYHRSESDLQSDAFNQLSQLTIVAHRVIETLFYGWKPYVLTTRRMGHIYYLEHLDDHTKYNTPAKVSKWTNNIKFIYNLHFIKKLWSWLDSNQREPQCKCGAKPSQLQPRAGYKNRTCVGTLQMSS